MKNKCFTLLFWSVGLINIVLFAANLLYVCHFYPTKAPVEFDYYGVIVAALSFLIAVLAILLGYNIFGLENKIDKSVERRKNEFKKEMESSISETKCQLYYTASMINKESGQIEGEFHNLFLSIEEALKSGIASSEYNVIENRIAELVEQNKQMEENKYEIAFTEPQLTDYIRIAKRMKGEKANNILQYLLSKYNKQINK